MGSIIRRSPVVFDRPVKHRQLRDHWDVVLEYEEEGPGPYLVDLSHRRRWDLQDRELDRHRPWQIDIPPEPGRCAFSGGLLVNRMNRRQAAIWHLAGGVLEAPVEPAYTETTDATVFLALFGPGIFDITARLSALDFMQPSQNPPFLLQGPFARVPCQIVVMERSAAGGGLVLTCARGWARDMAAAILAAGQPRGLEPAGEAVFSRWVESLHF